MCAYLIVLMMFSQIKAKMSADGSTRPGDRYVRWGIILPIALWVGVTGRLVISQTATTATSLIVHKMWLRLRYDRDLQLVAYSARFLLFSHWLVLWILMEYHLRARRLTGIYCWRQSSCSVFGGLTAHCSFPQMAVPVNQFLHGPRNSVRCFLTATTLDCFARSNLILLLLLSIEVH